MNNRENLILCKGKNKVINEMKNWSPQFREYYEKFGKKRDLEQFFLSHTFDRKPPEQNIVDSLELVGFGEHKICGAKEYSLKDVEDPILKVTSPEIRELPDMEPSSSPRVSFRSDMPVTDTSPEQEHNANASSPGTLSTSKKLEWDSLGDVGYANEFRGKEYNYQVKKTGSQKVSPKSSRQLDYKVGDPAAHSTPNSDDLAKPALEKKKSPRKSPTASTKVFKKSGKYQLSYKSTRPANLNFELNKYYSLNIPKSDESLFEDNQEFSVSTEIIEKEKPKERNLNNINKETNRSPVEVVSVPRVDKESQSIEIDNVSVDTTDHCEKDIKDSQREEGSQNEDLIDNLSNLNRCSPNVLSRADSFEYIPGNVYECATSDALQRESSTPDEKDGKSPKLHEHEFGSARSITSEDILKIFDESKSSDDIGPCIHKISKLLSGHRKKSAVKQKVVQKIVEILMQTNYPSDMESCSIETTPTTPSAANPADAESISNAADGQDKPPSSDKADSEETEVRLIGSLRSCDETKVNSGVETARDTDVEHLLSAPSSDEPQSIVHQNNSPKGQSAEKSLSIDVSCGGSDVQTKKQEVKNGRKEHYLKVLNDVDKHVHPSGTQSAPSTLTYSHYLKQKAEHVTSCPPSAHYSVGLTKRAAAPAEGRSAESTSRSTYRDIDIKHNVEETQTDLSKINEEILKLTLLKMKLDNKVKAGGAGVAALPVETKLNDDLKKLVGEMDKGASGDMAQNKSPQEPVLVYYNTINSPCLGDDYMNCVPPLDLANSSSSASSLEEQHINIKICEANPKTVKSLYCCQRSDKMPLRDICSDPQTSGSRCDKGTVRFVQSGDDECNQNFGPKASLPSKCSSANSCSSGLCACCKCKILYSQSSSTDSCTEELRKYRKVYDKYQKCITMKAFVKEYNELIKKYQTLKEKSSERSWGGRADKCKQPEGCTCNACIQTTSSRCSVSERHSSLKKTLDATTCTSISHRSVSCGSGRVCPSKSTSPRPAPAYSATEFVCHKCSNGENSEVPESLVCKVRKAFAKEYEDITRRLEDIKCSHAHSLQPPQPQAQHEVFMSCAEVQCPSTFGSSSGGASECNNDDLIPLSSQEYFVLSQESSKCACVDKCVCTSNSQMLGRSAAYTTTNVKSLYSNNPDTSEECLEINIEQCQRCKSTNACKCPGSNEESSPAPASLFSQHKQCQTCQSELCLCPPRTTSSSHSERIRLKKNIKTSKCDCCVQTVCSKSKIESSEEVSTSRGQTLRFSNSTYTNNSQKIIDSKCRKCPGKCNCKRNSESSRSRECIPKCVCKNCVGKKRKEEVCFTNKSVTTDSGGGTFRKCSKEVTVCKTLPQARHKADTGAPKCCCCHCAPRAATITTCSCTCSCKSHPSKLKQATSDDSVVMCLWCKAVPMKSNVKICNKCMKKHQQYMENVVERKKYICKSIPKAVAYNLIVESSESILEETIHKNNPKCLKNVVVKVAKRKSKKHDHKGVRIEQVCREDKCSTDEQIRDLSSLNSEQNKCCSGGRRCACQDKRCKNAQKECPSRTLQEMLEENRPDFVCNANGRQEVLKKYNAVRREHDARQRKILLRGVHSLSTINRDALDNLERIAREHGLFLPKPNKHQFKVFDSKEMVQASRRKYQKLPEMEKKKLSKKKQDYKKTNLLMASLFSKNLQKKTLKGVVDLSHSRQVISL